MTALRHIGLSLGLAAALLALWMRVLVPIGWMPASTTGGMTYVLCGGSTSETTDTETTDPHAGADHCAFSGIAPGLDAAPLLLPVPLLLPALALGMVPGLSRPGQKLAWLRPPLRGPPAR